MPGGAGIAGGKLELRILAPGILAVNCTCVPMVTGDGGAALSVTVAGGVVEKLVTASTTSILVASLTETAVTVQVSIVPSVSVESGITWV